MEATLWMDPLVLKGAIAVAAVMLVAYLARVNYVMGHPIQAAEDLAGPTPTADEIKAAYKKVAADGIDWKACLPARKDRRYIVVGGTGFMGATIVIHLLAMGTPPKAIRIIDARPPHREELTSGPAAEVQFVKADISSEDDALKAVTAPWPDSETASLPLTVFHTAAVMRFYERFESLYYRSALVNVGGVANVLAAARRAGAGIFISTSSSSVGMRNFNFWYPWGKARGGMLQALDGRDFFEEPRQASEGYISNYHRSKAEGERMVCAADDKSTTRTGVIRPGNGVYGHIEDPHIGRMLRDGMTMTFGSAYVQNWCHMGNASLAHLQYEDAMLGPHADDIAGRPWLVTDSGPALRFSDHYKIAAQVSSTGFKLIRLPPLLILALSYCVEAYTWLVINVPLLGLLFSEPGHPLNMIQPGTVISAASCVLDDSEARKKPGEGGIGYRSACTTMEGMCREVAEHNMWAKENGKISGKGN